MLMKHPAHPGRIIQDAIEDMRLSVTDAARALNVSGPTLSAILDGRSGISPRLAASLSHEIGSTPAFWLRLQAQYDRAQDEQRAE